MSSTTANLSSEDLRRVRQELWSNLQEIDTRLKQTYVPPHFRITTSSTNNQRTFSTNGHQTSNDSTSNLKRSRVSSSSYDEHTTSLPENNFDESSSKSLHSSIVPTNKIIKTKDDLISLVNRDQQSTGRNRRMFGVLLGTLNKFKAEANAYNEQTIGLKRHEIERRLEEKQVKEREDKQHERTELIATKKNCQQKLKLVNIKLEIMQRMANHEKIHLPLKNFIRTQTKPYVFYLPKGSIDEIFEKKFQESQIEIDKEIEEFKRDCQRELDLLDDTTNHNDDDDDDQTIDSKKRKLNDRDEDDEDNDDDDALADLPDEITLSAPEIKSEIVNTTTTNSTVEQSNNPTRTVIYDASKTSNQQDDQSMIDEE
jgi:pinin